MEKALLINRKEDYSEDADRIYCGNEFCEKLIPELNDLKSWLSFSTKKDVEFTFVTPFVTNRGLDKLNKILEFLNRYERFEVVVNDFGVLKLINDNFENILPVAGRLLSKQRRDPRINKILLNEQNITRDVKSKKKTLLFPKKVSPFLLKHYQSSVINLPIFQKYLVSQNVYRVEIDNLNWPMDINLKERKMNVSIYLPYSYVATTRMCGKLTLTYSSCKRECTKYFFKFFEENSNVFFCSIGNTVFFKSEKKSYAEFKQAHIDRMIFQPRLPF